MGNEVIRVWFAGGSSSHLSCLRVVFLPMVESFLRSGIPHTGKTIAYVLGNAGIRTALQLTPAMFHTTFGTRFQSKHVLPTTTQSPNSGMRKRKSDAGYGNVDSNRCCCDITLLEVKEYRVAARLISCEPVTLMDRGLTEKRFCVCHCSSRRMTSLPLRASNTWLC